MLWTKHDTDNTNVSGLPIAGAAIGAVSSIVLLAGIIATFVVKANPFVTGALWFIGDMGIGLSCALFWAGDRGMSLMRLLGYLAIVLLFFVGVGTAGVLGVGWIADRYQLNTPDGDTAFSMLCLFGILVPIVFAFVGITKWFERRFRY